MTVLWPTSYKWPAVAWSKFMDKMNIQDNSEMASQIAPDFFLFVIDDFQTGIVPVTVDFG